MKDTTPFSLKIFVLFFAFIGIFVTGIAVHETVHYLQFYPMKPQFDSICFAGYKDNAVGWYEFTYPASKTEDVQKIRKDSEVKAHIISSSFILLLALILYEYLFRSIYER